MPQIVSLLSTGPALPAATPATPAGAAAAPDTMLPADPTSPNFLAQFKAALKNIASAVVLPPTVAASPVAVEQAAGPLLSPVIDDGEPEDVESRVPELLADLGFVLVPQALPTLPVLSTPVAAAAPPPPRVAALPAQPLLAVPQPETGPAQAAPTQAQAQAPAPAPQPAPAVTMPMPSLHSLQPIARLKPADQPQAAEPAPAVAHLATPKAPDVAGPSIMLPPVPVASPPNAAEPSATAPAPSIGVPQATPGGTQSQPGSTSANDHNADRGTPERSAPVASEALVRPDVAVSDAVMATAVTTTAPISAAPVTGPSQVVSQIARHADLIRLPGNRGLRIQLHPDDLGGVQVTVRYAPGGALELHISAEHAATAALVQAGWAELRDALGTQGISADRLMLSITAPTTAGQSDFAGGGSRSDASSSGLSSQTGQGQARQDNAPQRTSPGWSGGADPVPSADPNARVAASAAPSRIDYRV